jgi:hypothetical protein
VIGLDRARQLKQLFLGGLGNRERSLLLEFHLGCIAMPMESAGRRSPLGPLGIGIILPVTGSRCGYCQGIDRRHYANN